MRVGLKRKCGMVYPRATPGRRKLFLLLAEQHLFSLWVTLPNAFRLQYNLSLTLSLGARKALALLLRLMEKDIEMQGGHSIVSNWAWKKAQIWLQMWCSSYPLHASTS